MRNRNYLRKSIGLGLSLAALIATASPAFAHNAPTEMANKKIVLDFYKALNESDATGTTKARIQGIAETYISPEYVQHSAMFAHLPGPGSARDKLVRMFQTMPARKLPPSKTLALMAEGDLVMMLTSREMPEGAAGALKPAYIFNMFRLKDGRLVEHWDVSDESPPVGAGPGMPPPGAPPGGPLRDMSDGHP